MIADGLQAHLDALQDALAQAGDDPRRGIEAIVGSLIGWVESNPGWAMFIYANLNHSGASSTNAVARVNQRYAQTIKGYFEPLIEARRLRAVPMECWPSLMTAPVHDYARRWLRGQVEHAPSMHRQVFADAAWRIVAPG